MAAVCCRSTAEVACCTCITHICDVKNLKPDSISKEIDENFSRVGVKVHCLPLVSGQPCSSGIAMFLTLMRLGKGIPGKQWIGKHRRPRAVTWQMKRGILARLEREAENEYWLSRPYMSPEQERGHSAERRLQRFMDFKATKAANMPEHKYLTDHLNHLKVTKNWSS
ncbi:hypothetical protein SKAU_G00180700 [Synaphobranchus kaupii]|uniref:Ribosomal protein 63, mitochondrial n=1 Tax=Synaphobranchus kaupii TaxID=118154 RepID=A0A9Q1J1M9_SYNKA|nr:hypothetical protein SKAU_G00180700 [Synaphobranchus kaupii]